MSYCWYCHWGWPEQNASIYDKYFGLLGESGLDYGPGHIVWADENFNTESIEWCIKNIDKYSENMTTQQKQYALEALQELLAIPEELRDPEPEHPDHYEPENYPPPQGMVMVRR